MECRHRHRSSLRAGDREGMDTNGESPQVRPMSQEEARAWLQAWSWDRFGRPLPPSGVREITRNFKAGMCVVMQAGGDGCRAVWCDDGVNLPLQ
jgi:hypothetical protein